MSKIKQWIKKGEGKTIEFKRTLPDGNHIAKTVISFSNMAGGLFFKIILYKKKRQQTTIETTAKASGENKKITPKTLSEGDISTSRETTAKDNGNTTTKTNGESEETPPKTLSEEDISTSRETTAKTSRENKKITEKLSSEEDIDTSGEMAEEKGTTIETTKETTTETTGKDSRKTTAKNAGITPKGLIDNNFKDKKTTAKTTKETTAKTSTMLIELIRKKPSANLNELAEHLQLTMDGVRYHLKNLKQKGIIKRIGSSREGYWKINEDRIPKSIT